MAKFAEREKARSLRRRGESIKEIARKINVSSSSVSFWCKDISLSTAQVENLQERQHTAGLRAVMKYAERKRQERKDKEKVLLSLGENDVGSLNDRDLYIAGLALYWGEGYKSGNGELGFTNSDPGMIKFILHWYKKIFKICNEDFILRVSVNQAHKERLREIEKYWSTTTGIPLTQFSKSSLIQVRAIKVYTNMQSHYGTLRIKVRKGTDLRRRILGGIGALKGAF